jgi:hypothetical protein
MFHIFPHQTQLDQRFHSRLANLLSPEATLHSGGRHLSLRHSNALLMVVSLTYKIVAMELAVGGLGLTFLMVNTNYWCMVRTIRTTEDQPLSISLLLVSCPPVCDISHSETH